MNRFFNPKNLKLIFQRCADDLLTYKLLNNVEPVNINNDKTLFVFSQRGMGFHRMLYLIVAHELSKRGYPSIFLFKDQILKRYSPIYLNLIDEIGKKTFKRLSMKPYFPELIIDGKEISNSLVQEIPKIKINYGIDRKLIYDWQIDFEKEIVKAIDVNFFYLIQTTLRSLMKRYNVDFKKNKTISISNEMIISLDLLIEYFFLLKKFSKLHNKQIRIVGWEYNYIPNSFFRHICSELSENRDVEYIDLNRGYKHYFGTYFRHSYVTAVNLTQSKFQNRNSIPKSKVIETINKVSKDEVFKPIENVVEKTKKARELNDTQKPIIQKCNNYLEDGKNVFVLFSHLFYDNPIYDQTDSFHDMCEWINYTINTFKNCEDLLLLKPHPKEIRPNEPQKQPNETLESYVASNFDSLPDNILLLNPQTLKLSDLFPFISCGLVWKSSASNELTYLGKPCIISGPSPFKAALDGLYYAKSKNHYVSLIKNVKKLKATDKQKLEIAAYIYVLYNKDIHVEEIKYDETIKNYYWNREKLFDYLRNGDNEINKIVEDMIK